MHSVNRSKSQDQPRSKDGKRDTVSRSDELLNHFAKDAVTRGVENWTIFANRVPLASPLLGLVGSSLSLNSLLPSAQESLAVRGENRIQFLVPIRPGWTCNMSFQKSFLHQTFIPALPQGQVKRAHRDAGDPHGKELGLRSWSGLALDLCFYGLGQATVFFLSLLHDQ